MVRKNGSGELGMILWNEAGQTAGSRAMCDIQVSAEWSAGWIAVPGLNMVMCAKYCIFGTLNLH
jgi:hypothetical protein